MLALLVLGLIVFVMYAEVRWDFLKLINPSAWLDRLPFIGKYTSQARQLQRTGRQVTQQANIAKRYLPGEKGVTSETNRKKQGQQVLGLDNKKVSGVKNWWKKLRGQLPEPEEATADSPPPPPTAAPPPLPPGAIPHPQPTNPTVTPATTAAVALSEQPRIGRISVPVGDVYSFSELPSTLPRDLLGKRIGRYQVDAVLESGTYSTIYQSFDQKLNRPVRLHVLRTSLFESEEEKPQFIQDLRQRVGLAQQGLTQVYDYDIQPDYIFVITELVQGPDILGYVQHLWSQSQQVSYHRLLTLLAQTAEALHTAHEQQLYHIQLTPRHIRLAILGGGDSADPEQQTIQPRVEDVGLGLLITRAEEAPTSAWPYLSPELAQEIATDGRSDVYALGAILYELVTGRPPYNPQNLHDVTHQHQRPATPPSELRPALPSAVEQIIQRAMSVEPSQRYQSAAELAQALYSAASGLKNFGDRNIQPSDLQAGIPWIRITTYAEAPRLIALTKDQMFIGNALNADVLLPSQGVASQHAYIRRSGMGWQVVDLDSHNGLFLDGVRLLSQVPEFWDSTREVRIGPYTLTRYDGGDVTADAVAWTPDSVGRVMAPATRMGGMGEMGAGISAAMLTLAPPQTSLQPGEQAVVQLSIINQTVRVEHFHVELDGLPSAWLTLSDNDIQLMPGTTGYLLLTITPAVGSQITAGEYPYRVTAAPLGDPHSTMTAEGLLAILPFERIAADLHPERIRTKGTAKLTLRNEGNLPAEVTLTGRDPADEVRFNPFPPPFTLAAGAEQVVDVRVEPRQRPFTGTNLIHPFDVTVATPNKSPLVKNGLLEVRPYLPTWFLAVLGTLAMLLCVLGAFAFNYVDEQNQRATASAALLQTPAITPTSAPTLTPTAVPLPLTCGDIRAQNAGHLVDGAEAEEAAVDGEYTIYLNRNPAQPLTIYCHNMASTPTEYITLLNTGEGVNFASVRYPAQQLVTSYTKLRIDPRTLVVDVSDRTFATVAGELPATALIGSVDYGTAVGCNEGVPGTVVANGNIDLTGLPLVLAEEATFYMSGLDVEGSGAAVSESRQVVEMVVGGRCGWVQPLGAIRLVYVVGEDE